MKRNAEKEDGEASSSPSGGDDEDEEDEQHLRKNSRRECSKPLSEVCFKQHMILDENSQTL